MNLYTVASSIAGGGLAWLYIQYREREREKKIFLVMSQ